ncbi:hypothetical protein [Streptomyces sp. ALB3]|uniref:hypothetical protein n=1 Tax=Streptomyces sp. ALB3 TaxID=3374278 RepID=UPI00379B3291
MSDFSGANRPDNDRATAVKQTAQEKAGEGVGLVGEKAADAAGTARQRAGDVAGEASSRARDVAGELQEQLQDQARTQTQRLAENVRRLADDLSDMGNSGRDGSPATNAVRRVADRGHDAAARLEDRGPQGLVSDLQDFARRHPGTFLAGAALAGFATARLGKGVKSANDGASSRTAGDRTTLPPTAAGDGGRSVGTDGDPRYGATELPDSQGTPQPTPSYGGSISPPGPLPVTDPYPNPDPRQQGG